MPSRRSATRGTLCSNAKPPSPSLSFVGIYLASQLICSVADGIHAPFNDQQAFFLLWPAAGRRAGDMRPEWSFAFMFASKHLI
jgi:hypothetical protein